MRLSCMPIRIRHLFLERLLVFRCCVCPCCRFSTIYTLHSHIHTHTQTHSTSIHMIVSLLLENICRAHKHTYIPTHTVLACEHTDSFCMRNIWAFLSSSILCPCSHNRFVVVGVVFAWCIALRRLKTLRISIFRLSGLVKIASVDSVFGEISNVSHVYSN